MKDRGEIAEILRERMRSQGISYRQLEAAAGIAHRTLQLMLGTGRDYRIDTLLAVADRLGLELVLQPKATPAKGARGDGSAT